MALVVEDGTGKADAESYLGVEPFEAYMTRRGYSFAGKTPEQKESALVSGTAYIDARYREVFPGEPTKGRLQALEWPRTRVYPAVNQEIADDEIPRELIAATAEAARRELDTPGSLTPDYVGVQQVKSETVGPISITYADAVSADDARPVVTVIDEILAPIITAPEGGTTAFLQRA